MYSIDFKKICICLFFWQSIVSQSLISSTTKSAHPKPTETSFNGLKCWIGGPNEYPKRSEFPIEDTKLCASYQIDEMDGLLATMYNGITDSEYDRMLSLPSMYMNINVCMEEYCNAPLSAAPMEKMSRAGHSATLSNAQSIGIWGLGALLASICVATVGSVIYTSKFAQKYAPMPMDV